MGCASGLAAAAALTVNAPFAALAGDGGGVGEGEGGTLSDGEGSGEEVTVGDGLGCSVAPASEPVR